MKKKRILSLVIAVVAVCVLATALTACNNATTQGQLVDAWKNARPYESYTYIVDDSVTEGTEGTYKSEIFYHAAYDKELDNAVAVGGLDVANERGGYLIASTLDATLDGKHLVYTTKCYFSLTSGSSYLIPRATERVETVDGEETFSMSGVYNGSTLLYTYSVNGGAATEGSVGLTSPYYDNNEFHQAMRGISTLSSSFSFAYSVPVVSALEQTSARLTFSVSGTETVELPVASVVKGEEGAADTVTEKTSFECYKASLSRATTVAGVSETLWYTVNPVYAAVTGEGESKTTSISTSKTEWWDLVHVLVKFAEPYNTADGGSGVVTYTLSEISLVAPDAQ